MRQPGNLASFVEGTKQVEARNKIAAALETKEGIPINDLHGLVKDLPEYWSQDGVHFNGKGIVVQADQGANWILESLQ